MARSSYAKRLTGQVAHRLPVLKPPAYPFLKWNPPQTPSLTETAPSLFPMTPAKATESSSVTRISSQVQPAGTLSASLTWASQPSASTPVTPSLVGKGERREVKEREIPQHTVHARPVSEPAAADRSIRRQTRLNAASQEEDIVQPQQEGVVQPKRVTVVPASTQQQAKEISFSQVGRAEERFQGSNSIAHHADSFISPILLSRPEPTEAPVTNVPAISSSAMEPVLDLQSSKKPASPDPATAPIHFESRFAQHPVVPAASRPRREPQKQNAGGVHIGTIEVRIMPPPAPAPIIKPVQPRAAAPSVLSRSFTSSLGLIQGQ